MLKNYFSRARLVSVLLAPALVFAGFAPIHTGAAVATGTLQVRIFEDKDGNGTYSPWPPEGDTFANTSYGLGQIVGDELLPVPASRCSGNGFKVDSAGIATCTLDEGTYALNTPVPDKPYFGPIKGPFNTDGSNPTFLTVTAGKTTTFDFGFGNAYPRWNKGNIHINAYVDTNWNAQYDLGEGPYFAGTTYDIFDQWSNKIDYAKYCGSGDNKLGGAGRDDCTGLPSGQYQVKFYGQNPQYMVGPFKNFYNAAGLNWSTIQVTSGGTTIVDFGYNFKADFEIRAWLDTDGNKQFSNGEGQAFAFKTYRMWNARGEELNYQKFCTSGDNKTGGVGRDRCTGIPDGVYKIQFYGADPQKHAGPIQTSNQSGSNPLYGVIYSGQLTTVDFAYVPKVPKAK